MNVFEVRLTRQAEEQLRGIAIYIAVELKNPDASTELMDDLEEELTRLGKNPEKYRLVDEQPWRDEGVRWTKVKNFNVYFWVDIENAAVHVTGICYEKRDMKKFLDNMKLGTD